VPDPALRTIVQYIKTFSPRWKDEEPGEAIKLSPDPFGTAKKEEAVALGKRVYHGLAQCWSCHPAFATKQEIYDAAKDLRHAETNEFRDDMYNAALKESDYGVNILPPDFTRQPLRSIRDGHEMEDLYRVIASGIGGTAMPMWKGALPEDQIWAMVYYVRSLYDIRDKPEADRLKAQLATQPDWKAPTPAPTPDKPATPEGKKG
jgi:mono/diheme cytochrome c family protein